MPIRIRRCVLCCGYLQEKVADLLSPVKGGGAGQSRAGQGRAEGRAEGRAGQSRGQRAGQRAEGEGRGQRAKGRAEQGTICYGHRRVYVVRSHIIRGTICY